jgi:hypothetical protein
MQKGHSIRAWFVIPIIAVGCLLAFLNPAWRDTPAMALDLNGYGTSEPPFGL